MDNEKRKSEKKQKIKGYISVALIVIVVIGAAIQICSRHGVDLSKIFSQENNKASDIKKETKPKPVGFDGKGLTDPYVIGKEDEEFPDSDFVKCSVDAEHCSGIKLSDVYYITDEKTNTEQIRFRYAIEDTSSTINLLVRGMVTIYDEFGNEMFGLYNALTDNFGSYRSQIVTLNLTNSQYSDARGSHFTIDLKVDTTKMGATYIISVPLEDKTVVPYKNFKSDGLQTPHTVGDNENNQTDSFVAKQCNVNKISSKGIELSNVYYIQDDINRVEQIRFRYALIDKKYDKALCDTSTLTLIDSSNNNIDGITVREDAKFAEYPAQTVNIDLSESSYSGASGKHFKVLISVEGTEYTAEYIIEIPSIYN